MAKITDLNEVAEMARTILTENEYELTARIGLSQAIFCLVAIYTTNDVCKGYGQDYYLAGYLYAPATACKISVISFENGVSVICDGAASRYQDRFPLCGYESLHDDLYQIAICIQAAFDRINSRS